jgi:iron complex transport system ATP-binding protein
VRYADNYIFLKDHSIYSAGNIHDITPEMVEAVYGVRVDIMHHKGLPVIIPVDGPRGIGYGPGGPVPQIPVKDEQAA